MPYLGAHVSVAGGVAKGLQRAHAAHYDAMQIFVKSPQKWQAKPLDPADITAFHEGYARAPLKVIAHAGYLINLCATSLETLQRSRAALQDELARCDSLGIPGLVLHPGAHLGAGVPAGIAAIASSLDAVFEAQPGKARVLLENTAGQGSTIGADFSHLRDIIATCRYPERLGVCLDTCHAFAAGYDLRLEHTYEALITTIGHTLGLKTLHVIHLNDSLHPLGAHKDRHASVGAGEIGLAGFAYIVQDPRLSELPMLLETPIDEDKQGHLRDLATLRDLQNAA